MAEEDAKLDAAQGLTNELHHLAADMEDKKSRLKKLQDDFATTDYTAKLEEKARRSRELQDQKDALNGEFMSLNLQADSRARLDLKRAEVRTKTQDVKNMCVFEKLDCMLVTLRSPCLITDCGSTPPSLVRSWVLIQRRRQWSVTLTRLLRTYRSVTCFNHRSRLHREKDRECKEAEEMHNTANRHLQTVETTVSNIQNQLKLKEDELKGGVSLEIS